MGGGGFKNMFKVEGRRRRRWCVFRCFGLGEGCGDQSYPPGLPRTCSPGSRCVAKRLYCDCQLLRCLAQVSVSLALSLTCCLRLCLSGSGFVAVSGHTHTHTHTHTHKHTHTHTHTHTHRSDLALQASKFALKPRAQPIPWSFIPLRL